VLYNAVAAVSLGKIIAVTASGTATRHFAPAPCGNNKISIFEDTVLFSQSVVYTEADTRARIFVRIGEDNISYSGGADLVLNPTAVAEYIGLSEARRDFASSFSASLGLPIAIVGAGEGESGTDGIYASPRIVGAGGEIIAEASLFDTSVLFAEIDLKKQKSADTCSDFYDEAVTRTPFIPEAEEQADAACELALTLQARSLALRMERSYSKKMVIGVSGGLDSTLALLVCARAADILGIARKDIIAITMPCFGTTERTKSNALSLAEELGCTVRTIDIKAAANQHFADISHSEND
jgi:NAD+ synthase (glutamine-hydrolysing)